MSMSTILHAVGIPGRRSATQVEPTGGVVCSLRPAGAKARWSLRLFIRTGLLTLIRHGEPAMTEDTVTFLDRMQKLDGGDLLRDLSGNGLQKLPRYDINNLVGPARHPAQHPKGVIVSVKEHLVGLEKIGANVMTQWISAQVL